ncbi:hypothetical protein HK097_007506 [Rhizophlyctis rosea]|uniref:RING-type domain-containing protein n=1 Tax=Rhizophlyctis rosea TaxID=64517 RepID=A0AAD5SBN4_9FUNG|nr:hypothetical protein HK097_007506 [Rhizophlyctis rosea]
MAVDRPFSLGTSTVDDQFKAVVKRHGREVRYAPHTSSKSYMSKPVVDFSCNDDGAHVRSAGKNSDEGSMRGGAGKVIDGDGRLSAVNSEPVLGKLRGTKRNFDSGMGSAVSLRGMRRRGKRRRVSKRKSSGSESGSGGGSSSKSDSDAEATSLEETDQLGTTSQFAPSALNWMENFLGELSRGASGPTMSSVEVASLGLERLNEVRIPSTAQDATQSASGEDPSERSNSPSFMDGTAIRMTAAHTFSPRVDSLPPRPKEEHTEDHTCPLCLQLLIRPITTPCGHSSCLNCFKELFNSSEVILAVQRVREGWVMDDYMKQCPQCRKGVTMRQSRTVDMVLDRHIQESYPITNAKRLSELANEGSQPARYFTKKVYLGNIVRTLASPSVEVGEKRRLQFFVQMAGLEDEEDETLRVPPYIIQMGEDIEKVRLRIVLKTEWNLTSVRGSNSYFADLRVAEVTWFVQLVDGGGVHELELGLERNVEEAMGIEKHCSVPEHLQEIVARQAQERARQLAIAHEELERLEVVVDDGPETVRVGSHDGLMEDDFAAPNSDIDSDRFNISEDEPMSEGGRSESPVEEDEELEGVIGEDATGNVRGATGMATAPETPTSATNTVTSPPILPPLLLIRD